jgi:cell division septation protein DedD
MVDSENEKKKGGETCDTIEGGYSIFLDGETIQSFMESGDYSSARELDHFREVESQVEKWLKEGKGVSLLALSVGDDRLSRDFSMLQIAHLMAKHGKRVLIVDCDFLSPGLSGLVENTEGYGFLDLLLYGSSLQSISRPSGIDGVTVAGPGSFPIARTIPFALKEFDKIRAFLAKRSDAVIYCSTLYTDDGSVNPLSTKVDGIVMSCRIEEMKEGQLQRSLDDLGPGVPPIDLICFCARGEAPAVAAGAEEAGAGAPAAAVRRPVGEKVAERIEEPPPRDTGEREPAFIEKTDEIEEPEETGRGKLNIPRIVTIAAAVVIIGFISWWVIIDRSIRGRRDADKRTELVQKQRSARDRTAGGEREGASGAVTDTVGRREAVPGATESAGLQETGERAVEDTTRAVGRVAPGEEPSAPGLESPAEGQGLHSPGPDTSAEDEGAPPAGEGAPGVTFAIHVASFRNMSRATREKEHFEREGYTVTVATVNIRGVEWYRILIGKYATREKAMRVRAELKDRSGVGYAQIIELK